MAKHITAHVTGKVQGVFFRDATREYAEDQGLCGMVRNEPDGSVYLEAEGDSEKIDAFVQWLKEGPSSAEVENVKIDDEGSPKGFKNFAIERPDAGYG